MPVEKEIYWKIFTSMGGLYLVLPFFGAISLFSHLEVYREKQIKKWANQVAKEQHDQFYW